MRQEKIMVKFFAIILLLSLVCFTALAKNATMAECISLTTEVNKSLPQMADKVTMLEGAACLPSGKRVILLYRMRLVVSKKDLPNYSTTKLKNMLIQTWCTSPDQREILEVLDIRYNYLDKLGSFIEEIDVKILDCTN